MIKAREKKILVSTLMLTIFGFVGKALGALFKIGMSAIVGSFGMGIYQLLFPILVFFIVFSSDGLSTALTVKVAENRGKEGAYFRYAQILCLLFSLVSFAIIIVISSHFADLQGEQVKSELYFIVAFGVVIISELSIYKAFLRGQERFTAFSLLEALEDLMKVVFGLVLGWLMLPLGIIGAVAGILLGIVISALLTLIFAVIFKRAKNKNSLPQIGINSQERSEFLKFSFFAMISSIIVPAVQFVESSIIIGLLSKTGATNIIATKLYGISRGSVSAIINLPFFVISALEILLLPNLSRSKNGGIYFKKTELCLLFAVAVSLPFVLFFVMFPSEVVGFLYGASFGLEEQALASSLLKIGAVGIIFSALASFLVIILNSNNKTFGPLLATILAGVVKLLFLIFLVPKMSIYAVELSSVIFSMIVCLVNLIFALKHKVIKRPKFVVLAVLFWVLVMTLVKLIYGWLQTFLASTIVALIVAVVLVGVVLGLFGFLVWIYLRKKHNNKACV